MKKKKLEPVTDSTLLSTKLCGGNICETGTQFITKMIVSYGINKNKNIK